MFGESIKRWRKIRGLSQLELSFTADISSKHISFLETGRSHPSREMVIRLSQALDVPLNERNVLLAQSGFAEAYSRRSLDTPEMKPVHKALKLMLDNHSPYPAIVLDWDWNIVMANAPQQQLTLLVKQACPNFPDTTNIMELLFDKNGFRPFVKNWEEVSFHLLQRLQRERLMHQDRSSNLLDRLLAYPDIPKNWDTLINTQHSEPMIHIALQFGDIELKMFSTLASFGTPIDITMQELIIEQYFPVDEPTKAFFEQLSNIV